MKKNEFLKKLEKGLKQVLTHQEVNEAIQYYDELINDRVENDELEEEVIASLGSIENIVRTISVESIEKRPKTKNIKTIYHTFISILRLATTPLLIFLSVVYVIVMFILGIVFFGVFITFFVSIIAIILSGIDSYILISSQGANIGHIFLLLGSHLFGIGIFTTLCVGLKNLIYICLNKTVRLFSKTIKNVGVK